MKKQKNPNAVALGVRGGLKTKETQGADFYRKIGKKGGSASRRLKVAKKLVVRSEENSDTHFI